MVRGVLKKAAEAAKKSPKTTPAKKSGFSALKGKFGLKKSSTKRSLRNLVFGDSIKKCKNVKNFLGLLCLILTSSRL